MPVDPQLRSLNIDIPAQPEALVKLSLLLADDEVNMEAGNPAVAIQTIARALHVFGELDRLGQLLDSSEDAIGLTLMDETLPKRVHRPKGDKDSGAL